MYRLVKLSGKYYAKDIGENIEGEEMDDWTEFLDSGEPVLIANELGDMADFLEISVDEISIAVE